MDIEYLVCDYVLQWGELYNMHCGERIQFSIEMLSLLLIMIYTFGTVMY